MKEINIINNKGCTGCKACVEACDNDAISYMYDKLGFWYPKIKVDSCIKCGKCGRICPELMSDSIRKHVDNSIEQRIYAARTKDKTVLSNSSSGGIFTELSKEIIKGDGVVFGCIWDNSYRRVKYSVARNNEEIKQMCHSKYIQNDTLNIYCNVKEYLDKEVRVLFSGTPCQVSALKGYLRKEYNNLICVDLICHGIGSPYSWSAYLNELESNHRSRVSYVEFRSKKMKWKEVGTYIEFENGEHELKNQKLDQWFVAFNEKGLLLRDSCYDCKYRGNARVGDITIGDFWQIDITSDEEYSDGISAVVINTDKGNSVFERVREKLLVNKKEQYELIQLNDSNQPWRNPVREVFAELLHRVPFSVSMNITDLCLSKLNNSSRKIDTIGFHLFDKWIRNARNGNSVVAFFKDNYYSNVSIYGMGIIGNQLFDELKGTEITVCYGIDKNADNIQNGVLPIIHPNDVKDIELRQIDVIVVTPMDCYYDIEATLFGLIGRFEVDVVSIETVIDYISMKNEHVTK